MYRYGFNPLIIGIILVGLRVFIMNLKVDMRMNRTILFSILLVLFPTLLHAQKEELIIEYREPKEMNYGTTVRFDFFLKKLKNGKTRSLSQFYIDKFDITCENGGFEFVEEENRLVGYLTLAPYPESYLDTITRLNIKMEYVQDLKGYTYTKEVEYEFRLNRKGKIQLDFSGNAGAKGKFGRNKKLFGTLFYYGANDGEDGTNGVNAADLELRICPFYTSNGDSLILIQAIDKKDSLVAVYQLPELYTPIHIDVRGGDGGNGGKGQRGSNKFSHKSDGGDGGRGGNGGNGGSLVCYIHPGIAFLKENVTVEFAGGLPGKGGAGGRAGKSKAKAETQFEGAPGADGQNGQPGIPGNAPEIRIEEMNFDWN